MQSVLFSIRAKGFSNYLRRGRAIVASYGLTPAEMVRALDQFSQILGDYGCEATFPITAIAAKRNSRVLSRYVARGIEFALHGYRHVDYARLALEEQLSHLRSALAVFAAAGVPVAGFRAPYLHFNPASDRAAREAGLDYVSNQPFLWDALGDEALSPAARAAYERAIALYRPWRAGAQPSLPRWGDQLVQIPVSLPDDEILVDRLGGAATGLVERVWSRMLDAAHQRQELLTLQLHPERTAKCAEALRALLAKARALCPPVWITRLDKLAAWWRAWSQATVTVDHAGGGEWRLSLAGPEGLALLARNVDVQAPVYPWLNGYQRCTAQRLVIQAPVRPFIGVPLDAPLESVHGLRQLGYLVETGQHAQDCSIYLDRLGSWPESERSSVSCIEDSGKPLVKLGRWPHDACSALAITGDIDALTLWDYGLKYLGN